MMLLIPQIPALCRSEALDPAGCIQIHPKPSGPSVAAPVAPMARLVTLSNIFLDIPWYACDDGNWSTVFMAEVYRRGKKKYLGIDFDPSDYEQLRQIAVEDGDRGVSSLVRSIVRSWLRSRNAGQALPTIMNIPQPPPARPSIVFAPSELVAAVEELPDSNEATPTPGEPE